MLIDENKVDNKILIDVKNVLNCWYVCPFNRVYGCWMKKMWLCKLKWDNTNLLSVYQNLTDYYIHKEWSFHLLPQVGITGLVDTTTDFLLVWTASISFLTLFDTQVYILQDPVWNLICILLFYLLTFSRPKGSLVSCFSVTVIVIMISAMFIS